MAGPGASDRTVTALLSELEDHGFTGQMAARLGAGGEPLVECFACHHRTPAATVDLVAFRRIEGASDPDDMLAVLGLVCGGCAQRATLVASFGPEAPAEDAGVLAALEDHRPTDPEPWQV